MLNKEFTEGFTQLFLKNQRRKNKHLYKRNSLSLFNSTKLRDVEGNSTKIYNTKINT